MEVERILKPEVKTLDELVANLAKIAKKKFREKGFEQIVVLKSDLGNYFGFEKGKYRDYLPSHIRRRLQKCNITVISRNENEAILANLKKFRRRNKEEET